MEFPVCWTTQVRPEPPEVAAREATQNQPSLPHREIGAFMALLCRLCEGAAARAQEFAILTAPRT